MANTTKPVIKKQAAKKEAAKQPAIKSSAIKKTTAKKPAAKKLAGNIGGIDPDVGGVDLDAGGVQPGVMLGADIYPNPAFRVKNWKTTWVGPRGFTWHLKKLTWAAEEVTEVWEMDTTVPRLIRQLVRCSERIPRSCPKCHRVQFVLLHASMRNMHAGIKAEPHDGDAAGSHDAEPGLHAAEAAALKNLRPQL